MRKSSRKLKWVFMVATLLIMVLVFSIEDNVQASWMETVTASGGNLKKEIVDSSELALLQIPQRMEIIIDPWEMDGREQIYSKEYTVRNMGEMPGTLILEFSCKVRENIGVSFQDNSDGIHYSGEKLIYMKALFGNGEETVFTREGVKYRVELQPGETLSLKFTGEVNENADEPWKDGDIEIEGTYFWEVKTAQSDEALEETPEVEKENADETILASELEKEDGVETVSPNKIEQNRTGEEQVSHNEAEQKNARDSSLSGNALEE